jgi:N-acetylglucosaminylphosphatidylinositol deacetylase
LKIRKAHNISFESTRFLTYGRKFPDSITIDWDPKLVSDLLFQRFAPKMAKIPLSQKPQTDIDILITFDKHGISSHPNHRSLYHGARAFLQALMHRRSGWESPIKMYSLTTTNILRKYISIFDAPLSVLGVIFSRKEAGSSPAPLLFVSAPGDYRKAQKSMTTAHKSQMVWFRWGWIGTSRYMVINALQKERLV